MDTGEGRFKHLTKEEGEQLIRDTLKLAPDVVAAEVLRAGRNLRHLFLFGEELEIKGSRFRIVAIGTDYMRLRLLPWKKEELK